MSAPVAGPTALRTELDALLAAVSRMAEIAQEGGLVDIVALEEAVGGFCRRVEAAPAGTSKPLRRGLVALMDELARLDATMRQAHAALAERLGDTAQRRRATAAYGAQSKRSR